MQEATCKETQGFGAATMSCRAMLLRILRFLGFDCSNDKCMLFNIRGEGGGFVSIGHLYLYK